MSQIHVLRTESAEYISAQPLAMNGDGPFPIAQVVNPIFVTKDVIVIGQTIHVVGGQLEDLLFDQDGFESMADAGYFSSITGDDARRILDYLCVKFSAGS